MGRSARRTRRSRCSTPRPVQECPPVDVRGPTAGRRTCDEAVGEIVETAPTSGFEGYYRNEEATQARFRDGWYWSGDLAYRDADGWLYFAGRSNEWLRVDGENFAAAPVEAIIARHPDVRSLAVYAVPDDPVGDRVMVALELADGASSTPSAFDAFLAEQPDLGPKWLPAFVRVDRGAAEAGQHEDRQAAPAARGVAGRTGVLAVRQRANRSARSAPRPGRSSIPSCRHEPASPGGGWRAHPV